MKIERHIAAWLSLTALMANAIEAKSLAQEAEPTAGYISDEDFPAIAIRRGEQGTVIASFTIGADGRASGCGSFSVQNIPVLEAVTCLLITERFVFQPARDSNGKVVTETRSQRITWRLPKPDASSQPFAEPTLRSAALGISYRVQADGYVSNCVATGTTFDGSEIAKVCEELKWQQPILDERGAPIAKRIAEKHTIEVQADF